jgi:hypothetical protein
MAEVEQGEDRSFLGMLGSIDVCIGVERIVLQHGMASSKAAKKIAQSFLSRGRL